MAEDAGNLLQLMLTPEVMKLYSKIREMQPGQLVKRLEFEAVSIDGEMPELRGRLLRLEVRRQYPELEVPWYLEDEISVERSDDSTGDVAEALWQLRETPRKAEADVRVWRMEDDDFSKLATVDRLQTSMDFNFEEAADITEDEVAFETNNEEKNTSIIHLTMAYLMMYYKCIPKFEFTKSSIKTTLFVAFDVLKLGLYTWLLDSYVFYNKGFHIYVAVYWSIMSLYSLYEDENKLYVYVQNYPFEHQTKLLMHSLIRVVVVAFSFACINSFIWFDNIMLMGFMLFNLVTEMCILVREINDYENSKCAPNYFLYSEEVMHN